MIKGIKSGGWKGTGILLGLALLAGAGIQFPAAAKVVEEIALVVNRESLTSGELDETVQALYLARGMKLPKDTDPEYQKLRREVAERYVRDVLVAEEAERMGISVSDNEVEKEVDREIENMRKAFPSVEEFRKGLEREGITLEDLKADAKDKIARRLKTGRALRFKQQQAPGSIAVVDEDARKFFEEHAQDYERVKFAVILFRIPKGSKSGYAKEVEKQAKGVLAELKAGADFAEYAKRYSEEPNSAQKGGELGTFDRSELDPELAKGIFAIPVKGLGTVKAPEGVYVVRVDSKTKPEYADVAQRVKETLRKGKEGAWLEEWILELWKNAYVRLDGEPFLPSSMEGKEPSGAPAASPDGASEDVSTTADDPVVATLPEALFPSLSPAGSFTFSLRGLGLSYGTGDLAAFHGPGVTTDQGFPFGFGLAAGLEYALEPTWQVGVQVEYLRKITERVNDGPRSYYWDSSVVAPSLTVKLTVPLDEGSNFILAGAGGYHFMPAASLHVDDGTDETRGNLSGEGWGGTAGGILEFFLDEKKSSALAVSVDYRFLTFTPVTVKDVVDDLALGLPSPLLNIDGSQAKVDFSGINVGLGLRFYLGKE